jgi:RNA polymerase sigma factor (sigma-70 family)
MSDESRQDGDLITRILAGESNLFGVLVGKYERLVFSYLLPQVRNLQEVEDLAQETFLRAYRHLAGFDTSRKFSAWLLAIARNLLVDRFRKNSQAAASQESYQEMLATQGPFPVLGDPQRQVEIGVRLDKNAVVAAEFKNRPPQPFADYFGHAVAHLAASGGADERDAAVGQQPLAHA